MHISHLKKIQETTYLVEEGGLPEARRHVQLGRHLDPELGLGGLGAGLVDGPAGVGVLVLAEDAADGQLVEVAGDHDLVLGRVEELPRPLQPRHLRLRAARDAARERRVLVLHRRGVLQRLDDLGRLGLVRILGRGLNHLRCHKRIESIAVIQHGKN